LAVAPKKSRRRGLRNGPSRDWSAKIVRRENKRTANVVCSARRSEKSIMRMGSRGYY
jgi:hypothetical protein